MAKIKEFYWLIPMADNEKAAARVAKSKSTRVDEAHLSDGRDQMMYLPPREELAAIAGLDSSLAVDQSQRQASELAHHLRSHQQQLDQREADLNARLAHLENELRSARLKSQEACLAIDKLDREMDLGWSEKPSSADAARHADAFEQLQQETVSRWRDQLGRHLDAGPADHEPLSEPLRSPPIAVPRAATPVGTEPHRPKSPIPRARPRHRQATAGDIREQLDGEGRALERELSHKWDLLLEKKQHLDRRRAIVEQLHEKTHDLHRESLEMRLVTEQLWAELSGRAAPAALTRSIARLHARLTDSYRLASDLLASRKKELIQLREQISQSQRRLRHQSSELQEWIKRRYAEVEQHAARLAARETELESQQQRLCTWESEKRRYQQRIDLLLAELEHRDADASSVRHVADAVSVGAL